MTLLVYEVLLLLCAFPQFCTDFLPSFSWFGKRLNSLGMIQEVTKVWNPFYKLSSPKLLFSYDFIINIFEHRLPTYTCMYIY